MERTVPQLGVDRPSLITLSVRMCLHQDIISLTVGTAEPVVSSRLLYVQLRVALAVMAAFTILPCDPPGTPRQRNVECLGGAWRRSAISPSRSFPTRV